MPQTAQAYAAVWLAEGYLVRRFPSGANEESYELSAPAAAAIRFIASLHAPRAAFVRHDPQRLIARVLRAVRFVAAEHDLDVHFHGVILTHRDRLERAARPAFRTRELVERRHRVRRGRRSSRRLTSLLRLLEEIELRLQQMLLRCHRVAEL